MEHIVIVSRPVRGTRQSEVITKKTNLRMHEVESSTTSSNNFFIHQCDQRHVHKLTVKVSQSSVPHDALSTRSRDSSWLPSVSNRSPTHLLSYIGHPVKVFDVVCPWIGFSMIAYSIRTLAILRTLLGKPFHQQTSESGQAIHPVLKLFLCTSALSGIYSPLVTAQIITSVHSYMLQLVR